MGNDTLRPALRPCSETQLVAASVAAYGDYVIRLRESERPSDWNSLLLLLSSYLFTFLGTKFTSRISYFPLPLSINRGNRLSDS